MKNVLNKLQQARMKLAGTVMRKSGHNKFAGYSYFELGDFITPVQAIFSEIGLCGVVSFGIEVATLTITDLESGEQVQITSPMSSAALKGCHEVQNLGAVQTYIRRYLWVAAMEIVEHDALDSSKPIEPVKHLPPVKAAMQSVELNDEDMEWLRSLAAELVQTVEVEGNAALAYDHLDVQKLDSDQKLALWDILSPNSRTRSALKKEGESRRKAA